MDNVGEIQSEFDKIVNESLTKVPAGKRDFTFQTVRDLLKVM
jgi:hypothetical protein